MANPWVARHGMTSDVYQAEFDKLGAEGFRLQEVSGYSSNGTALYAAIWEKTGGPAWIARHGMTSADYQAEFDKLIKQGYRLTEVSGYPVGGDARYAAIWTKAGGPAWVARHGMTSDGYQAEFDTLVKQGYRLTDVSGYAPNGQARYAAIWEKAAGPPWVAHHGMTASDYQAKFDKYTKQGYRLVVVNGYAVGSSALYAAIFVKKGGPAWIARHGMTSSQYQAEFDKNVGVSYKLTWVSGYSIGGSPRYAAIWEHA